jgi:hypothetical protein
VLPAVRSEPEAEPLDLLALERWIDTWLCADCRLAPWVVTLLLMSREVELVEPDDPLEVADEPPETVDPPHVSVTWVETDVDLVQVRCLLGGLPTGRWP